MPPRSRRDAYTNPKVKAALNELDSILSKKSAEANRLPESSANISMPKFAELRIEVPLAQHAYESGLPPSEMAIFEENIISRTADDGTPQGWIIVGLVYKYRADKLFKQKQYTDAKNAYIQAIRITLGQDDSFILPSTTAVNEIVVQSEEGQLANIVACANNIAQCCIHEKKESEALDWLEELHCWYLAYAHARKVPAYDWKDFYLMYEEYLTARVKAWLRQSEIWTSLGNSSGAVAASWEACKYGAEFSNAKAFMANLRDQCQVIVRTSKRHPDPEAFDKVQLTHLDLQVRGAWKKIRLAQPSKEGPGSRSGFASFVWNGKYHVFGGEHASKQLYTDGWVLDLRAMTGWHPLPFPPTSIPIHFHRIIVWKDKAYLFQGSRDVLVFNMHTQQWSKLATKMRDGTLWTKIFPGNTLIRYAIEAYDDVLYVFGGGRDMSSIGRNTLVALDLKTQTWEILSGTAQMGADYLLPGLREHAASWLVDGKLYITLGSANRTGALTAGAPQGADYDHSYRDIWSYDIESKQWTREKFSGNPPCPRTEVGFTYNEKWNLGVVFGGYNSQVPFLDLERQQLLTFNYFGDTFIWSRETGKWSQVIARGFPTYRAMASLFTDQETGKTYLFGGYTNTEFTPSTRAYVQSFNDLWELCLDVPGCDFDEADSETDPRFSKLGPWKRCYSCGAVGRWKMCGGVCRKSDSPAYFCGTDCQRAGWAEHKRRNGCRKA